jgi:hypothetical protein
MSAQPTSKEAGELERGDIPGFLRLEAHTNAFTENMEKEDWGTPTQDSVSMRQKRYAQGGNPLSHQAGAWPTPMASDENDRQQTENWEGQDLVSTTKNWPTPTTQEVAHADAELTDAGRRKTKGGADSHSLNLQDRTASWPTPSASEHKARLQGNSQQSNGLTATARKDRSHYSRPPQMIRTAGHGSSPDTPNCLPPTAKRDTQPAEQECSPKCRRLNPNFCEWLMGLCPGWTDASEPLATGLYLLHVRSLSIRLAEEGFFD